MALRAAIGASRGRLITQALSEGLLLSGLSGIAGVLLAWGGVRLFLRVAPSSVPGLDHISATGIDLRVLVFTALITVLTALVFGVAQVSPVYRRA
jgi:ABC-type antimicrobial peptide transport system permease subunit